MLREALGYNQVAFANLVEWLWSRAIPNEAERLADAIRPLLDSLDDDERALFINHATEAMRVLAAGAARRKRGE